ncbi:MAG: fatty acyl-AMP ligase [Alphaproteobacteria bacterium]|nr:fatty acyl-AMP ligase [Alphaproteobacteria bacterium]
MPRFATVSEAVARAAEHYPHQGYVFQDMKGDETWYPYAEVERLTAGRAAALQAQGLRKGDRIGLVVIEPEDFVLTFLAALRVGVVPVPLYPPMSFAALDAYAERTARVLELSGARALFASSKLQNVLWALVDQVPTLERLVPVEELAGATGTPDYPEIAPDDTAFLQYTSGSTADPKGVVVTHANLIANSHAIIVDGLKMEGRGCAVAWLPLYHDMGLIGFVIATITNGLKSVFLPTMRFIKKPTVWMDAIHTHRATVTFAPNFAYALITKKARPEDLSRWDLSCMEAFGCGAEPIQAETVRAFNDVFTTHCGLSPNAFLPAYGMAEATLAISFKPMSQPWRSHRVDAVRFQTDGTVAGPLDGEPVFEHVSCGPTFPGHEMVAVDDDGRPLPEGREGQLALRGPSVTPGYFNNPEATAAAFRDGWLLTGDLGYVLDGEIYVTGRLKDLIILNGRNVHPQAIEWAASEVAGVRKGNVVAFSRPGAESEELVVVLETRDDDTERVIAEVKKAVRQEVGAVPSDVVCLPPGTLPKTSSGKLQRRKTRQQYLLEQLASEGARTMGSAGSTMTIARHVARSVWTRTRTTLLGR